MGVITRVKNPSLNDSNLFQLVLSGPAVPISEGRILDPCIICTKSTHIEGKKKKGKYGLKSLVTTRSIIVNHFTKNIHIVFQSTKFTMFK